MHYLVQTEFWSENFNKPCFQRLPYERSHLRVHNVHEYQMRTHKNTKRKRTESKLSRWAGQSCLFTPARLCFTQQWSPVSLLPLIVECPLLSKCHFMTTRLISFNCLFCEWCALAFCLRSDDCQSHNVEYQYRDRALCALLNIELITIINHLK